MADNENENIGIEASKEFLNNFANKMQESNRGRSRLLRRARRSGNVIQGVEEAVLEDSIDRGIDYFIQKADFEKRK